MRTVILCLVLSLAGGEKVMWDKAETATAKSQASGKPILYYFLTTQQTGDGKGGGGC